ncbi:piggyBac transposable element-derived protein 4-like [Octopus sinensis]|uniref:PiggyBac transposable element-derived protein 4-like n=1 Tax=Octopus sinensis TaxID=2607531 RepID=A0A6P7S6F1_9MOLL|nr:piggyBac transposable element-derived protein 4-like [Octopus sinensis]
MLVQEEKKRSDDKLESIREVFEMWNHNLQDGYAPSSCMTVDEQLVSFRGHCPLWVYIPSKLGKYRIKIWATCDSETSYTWKMQIYTRKDPVKGGGDLVKELEIIGRNITCDNFFTSLGLARELLSKKTVLGGTIRKNRVELPSASTNGKEINNTIFGFRKDSMILSYCPKKNYVVIFMSTMHSQPSIDSKSAEKKLEVTTCYNKTKGGVDTLDKMVRTYTCKRMTRRWHVVIFYNMTDISAVNVFIVAKQIHLQSFKDKRSENLIQLGKELAGVNAKQEQDKQSSSSANISQPNKKRTQTSTSF